MQAPPVPQDTCGVAVHMRPVPQVDGVLVSCGVGGQARPDEESQAVGVAVNLGAGVAVGSGAGLRLHSTLSPITRSSALPSASPGQFLAQITDPFPAAMTRNIETTINNHGQVFMLLSFSSCGSAVESGPIGQSPPRRMAHR